MNNNNTTYHPLGDYIRPVDVRNKDLKVTTLLGLSIEKCFIPSIANTIGTDMSTYKVVMPGQFAYGPVTSRNGDKITIALYTGDEPAIISQAYVVFEIMDAGVPVETHGRASLPDAPSQLLPEYLMMWFRRPEFDRYARYHSHGSAREIFDWAEMCATMVPVPPITEQRAVVADYEAVARRIAVAKRTIATLQATAQTLYRKMFVDGIDKENLPEGWRWGKLGEYAELSQGIQIELEDQSMDKKAGYNRFIRIIDYTPNTTEPPRYVKISDSRYCCTAYDIVMIRYGDAGTVCRRIDGVIANNLFKIKPINGLTHNYLYYFLKSEEIQNSIKGSAASSTMPAITHSAVKDLNFIMPSSKKLKEFDEFGDAVEKRICLNIKEIKNLTKIQSLLLAGMGK